MSLTFFPIYQKFKRFGPISQFKHMVSAKNWKLGVNLTDTIKKSTCELEKNVL